MLESFRKGQRWLTLIFVSVIGLVFVFFFGVGGTFGPPTPTGGAVVQLDDVRLTTRDFQRERQNTEARLREQLGDAFDQMGAERYVDSQALGSMVNSLVLAAAAEEMGLHVTRDEVRRVVQSSPGFIDAEGRFSPEAFNYFAEREYGTQREFIRNFTRALLGQKLIQLLLSQTSVSDDEIDLWTHYDLDEVRIAYVALDETTLPADVSLSEEEVEAWASEHDADLRATFAEREEALAEPERVRARHLMVRVPADASPEEEAEARSRAEAARARIEGGEPFAEVAAEVSEDVATASEGGELGVFAPGSHDPAVDEAAFALEPGGLSEVVRSDYGFHVVQVDERLPGTQPTFETERLALAREALAAERARELAVERAEALAAAVEAGQSLEDAAREMGLTLERPPALKRRPDGYVPGLGAAEALLTTAFTLDEGESSPEIFEIDDQQVLIQVLDREIASAATVAAEREARRERMLAEKQNQVLDAWLGRYRSELERSGRLRVNAELALGA